MAGKCKRVYVGCRANVNRSFILEQILSDQITRASLPIDISSGGVMVVQGRSSMAYYPGEIIEFVLALQKTGFDFIIPKIRQHQAHAFTIPDIQSADLIITMTRKQREHLKQYALPTTQIIMLSQLRDPSHEEDIFDAMQERVISVEAFVRQINQLKSYADLESVKNLLGLTFQ
jgi:protein-tyrosine-phosphatase